MAIGKKKEDGCEKNNLQFISDIHFPHFLFLKKVY